MIIRSKFGVKMTVQEQFNLAAKEYDENRRKFIPCFDDFYISTTDFAAKTLEAVPNPIFDLGSGTWLLTYFWLKHFPNVKYILADFADKYSVGVKKTTGKTASSVIKQYGYDSFYYQRVN